MRAATAVAVILAPIAATLVELALAALLIAVLALEAFTRRATALVVTRRTRLCGARTFGGNRRRIRAWPAMLVVAVAAMAAMTLALLIATGSGLTFGCGSRGFIRPLVAAAIMTRTALVGTTAGRQTSTRTGSAEAVASVAT